MYLIIPKFPSLFAPELAYNHAIMVGSVSETC